MADFNLQRRLNDVATRVQGLRPGILPKKPLRSMLGMNVRGPGLFDEDGSGGDVSDAGQSGDSGTSGDSGAGPAATARGGGGGTRAGARGGAAASSGIVGRITGGPGLMDLIGRTSGASSPDVPLHLKYRTSGASGPPGWLPSATQGPFKSLGGAWAESPQSGVAVIQAGYREGVSPRPRTWNGYRFTS